MVVFTVILGKLLGLTSGSDVPYALFVFTGLLPWNLFSGTLGRAGTSLVGNANLLTKVYFPRLVIPISVVLGGLVDFAIAFAVMLGLMAYYGYPPTWAMLWLPALTLLCVLTTLSVAVWLSALNVMYRDVQYIIPFLIQVWFFVSPVVYPVTKVPTGIWRHHLRVEPVDGRHPRVPMGDPGGAPPSKLLAVAVIHCPGAVRQRPVLLQACGARLRGCGVGDERTGHQTKGLGKRYLIGMAETETPPCAISSRDRPQPHYAASSIGGPRPAARARDWALRGLDLEVQEGETLGVVGRNGAGKSTLLKLLSSVTDPTEGSIDLSGSVGSLLEVGTGFHPELTGRENIFLNGAILGMRRAEIRAGSTRSSRSQRSASTSTRRSNATQVACM